MKKILTKFLIILLIFSTFPVHTFAESIEKSEDLEEVGENVILLSEVVGNSIPLLDFETLEVIYNIPDDSEAQLIDIIDHEYAYVQYTSYSENEKNIFEGLVDLKCVYNEEEAEKYRENRKVEKEIKIGDKFEKVEEQSNQLSNENNDLINDDEQKVNKINDEKQSFMIVNEESNRKEDSENNNIQLNTFSLNSQQIIESSTSRLGHIRNQGVYIYKQLGSNNGFKAGTEYTNAVYYIKRQAVVGNETYYLLSTRPSATSGVVGWAKSSDLSTHPHVTVDKRAKTLYVKGNGKATTKAWGGNKDTVYPDLTKYKNRLFKVNLTETVGNNTWYRGILDGKQVWLHSSYVHLPVESSTSRLGHIRNRNVEIHKELGEPSFKAGAEYTNAVYYIKRQAIFGSGRNAETYYLLSTRPSATSGVVGWAKSSDLSTHPHVTIDKQRKMFVVNGKGKATTKAWGGNKDTVYPDLTLYKGYVFDVNMTEKVGNNTWYRGILNGKEVWLHSSYVDNYEINSTSRLGHIRSRDVNLYDQPGGKSFQAGAEYTNAVYYIKAEARYKGTLYYLLSTNPSATSGVVGWARSTDLSTHPHITIDKNNKLFYIAGTGKAYSKAWGGNKDLVYNSLKDFEDKHFSINLTEKVGNNTWYRGKINGEGTNVWIHASYLTPSKEVRYNLSLDEATNIQMKVNPQTDKYYAYVSAEYVENGVVTATSLNVRVGPGTNYKSLGTIAKDTKVTILDEINGWYAIEYSLYSWVTAIEKDVKYYLDPNNFIHDSMQRFQFLDLSLPSGAPVSPLNNYLKNKGILSGKGQAFIDAAKIHGINEIYLLSHALLETGHGTSPLATGIKAGRNPNGEIVVVTEKNSNVLTDIKTVYNMYGINAKDSCPIDCGVSWAYEQEWFTPEKAIIGGAAFIGNNYVKAGQNTLYKMRWNPKAMEKNNRASHQYARDIGWAYKQVRDMYNIYQEIGITTPILEIPVYK